MDARATASSPLPRWKVWALAARPKTLPAAAAPVLVGIALAVEAGVFEWVAAVCALLGALLIQVGTNYANDYHDFVQGADTAERVGPMRVTQAGLVRPEETKRAAVVAFALAVLAGAYLMWRGGWPIVAVGALSLACGWLYTAGPRSLAYLGVADLFVLVFFGPVAVAGTFWVQAAGTAVGEELWLLAAAVGLGPGFLATAILLANNIRDVEQDRVAHKRTLVVRFGRALGVGLYAACALAAALVPVGVWMATGDHAGALFAAPAPLLLAGPLRTFQTTSDPARLNPLLGKTAGVLLVYSVVLALGWVLG
jgi:1,4-dihydroxy-2-naphthoate octaprenyltransferase